MGGVFDAFSSKAMVYGRDHPSRYKHSDELNIPYYLNMLGDGLLCNAPGPPLYAISINASFDAFQLNIGHFIVTVLLCGNIQVVHLHTFSLFVVSIL